MKFLVAACLLTSCGFLKRKGPPILGKNPPSYKKKYELVDKAGKFFVYRQAGKIKRGEYVVKREVTFLKDRNRIVEKSIALATLGTLKSVNILRPKISQYAVWFNKKRYFSELKWDNKTRSIVLRMQSPEERWNGSKRIAVPKGTGVFCFFSMVMECAAATGFIKKAVSKGVGSMNFYVIWDGHPYIREQYQNLPEGIFSPAELAFEGAGEGGEQKFSLSVGGEAMFYFVRQKGILEKMFWVSQGMSMVAVKK